MSKELIKLCVDTVKNPTVVQQFSKGVSADEAIRKEFFEIMGTEKPSFKDIRRHKVAVFEILEEVLQQTIIDGVDENQFFMQFAEVRNVALGDSIEFYVEDNSILVASEFSGNHWDITRQKLDVGQSFGVKTKDYAVGVYADFAAFLAGRIDFARLIAKTSDAMQAKITEEVAASFNSAAALLPTGFKETGTYAEAKLLDLVANVEAATGRQATVVGTRKGMSKVLAGIATSTLVSEDMKRELNATGTLQVYNGLTLVTLPQVFKRGTTEFAYDDDTLFVMAGDARPVKIVFEGESLVKEVSDGTTNMDMSLEYKFLTKWGCNVVFDSVFGVYTLS